MEIKKIEQTHKENFYIIERLGLKVGDKLKVYDVEKMRSSTLPINSVKNGDVFTISGISRFYGWIGFKETEQLPQDARTILKGMKIRAEPKIKRKNIKFENLSLHDDSLSLKAFSGGVYFRIYINTSTHFDGLVLEKEKGYTCRTLKKNYKDLAQEFSFLDNPTYKTFIRMAEKNHRLKQKCNRFKSQKTISEDWRNWE